MIQIPNRDSFRKNFLIEVILRLDFQGVLQAEMEKILLEVKPYLKSKAFSRYQERINNQAVIEGMSIKEATSQIEYSYTEENTGYELVLSTTSIVLIVHSSGYSPFEEYSDIFLHVAKIYMNSIDFFTVTRFGYRKINSCFVANIEDIEQYFEKEYLSITKPIDEYDTTAITRSSQLSDGKRIINLKYLIEQGELNNNKCHKVTLDFDIFTLDMDEINTIIRNTDEMKRINQILFLIYCKSITDKMAEVLMDENSCLPKGLEGIRTNE